MEKYCHYNAENVPLTLRWPNVPAPNLRNDYDSAAHAECLHLLDGQHSRGRAVLLRIVKQLADTFHSRGYYKYSYVVAVRVCRDDKIALPFRIITQ